MEECAEQEVIIPDVIQQQINHLNSDWEKIQKLGGEIKPVTAERMEIITQGIVDIRFISGGNWSTRRKPVASHWQTLSYNVVSSTPHHEQGSNSQL